MNVDRIAEIYRWIEYAAFGRALERCRFAFVDRLSNSSRVLIIGEGDGRFLTRLLAVNAHVRVDVIELSGRMVELARERLGDSGTIRVCFRIGDVRTAALQTGVYDAVVTNFILDCFSEADAALVIGKLHTAIASGGLWLVNEFHQPDRGWRRLYAAAWLSVMYTFFRVMTGLEVRRLPPYRALLSGLGMVLVEERTARFGLMNSQLWQAVPDFPVRK